MKKKSIHSSIRMSQEEWAYICKFKTSDAEGFNIQLSNAIQYFMKTEKSLDERIKTKQEELKQLEKNISEKKYLCNQLRDIEVYVNKISSVITN